MGRGEELDALTLVVVEPVERRIEHVGILEATSDGRDVSGRHLIPQPTAALDERPPRLVHVPARLRDRDLVRLHADRHLATAAGHGADWAAERDGDGPEDSERALGTVRGPAE